MGRIRHWLERFSLGIETIAGIMMAVVTLVIVVSAAGRYLFASPLPDAFDLSRYLLGIAIMWGFASVGFRGSHIKVDLVAELLPRHIRRWIDAFAWSVLLLFTTLLAWKMFGRVASAARSGEATMDMRLDAWPFLGLIWLGVVVSLATILARLVIILAGKGSLDPFDGAEVDDASRTQGQAPE